MTVANPVGTPLKRCHQDQRECLTIQPYADGTAAIYDDAVVDGPSLLVPTEDARRFVLITAIQNSGYTEADAAEGKPINLPITQRIVASFDPISGDWVLSDPHNPEIKLHISAADARMFVVGAVDGTFAEITKRTLALANS